MKKNVVRILALVLVGLMCLSLLPAITHADWCQHTQFTTVTVEPVCGEDGYTAAVCLDCGEEFGMEIIPHTEEHDYSACVMNDDYLISAGDCLTPSLYYKSCVKCGHIAEFAYQSAMMQMQQDLWEQYQREVSFYGAPVTNWEARINQATQEIQDQYTFKVGGDGHHFYEVEGQPATCLDEGWEPYRVCEYCGEVEGYQTIPAKGHRFGEYVVTAEPGCTENGIKQRVCEVCGEVEEETVPALGHQGPFTTIKAPTCTEPGSEKRICTVCGAEEIREIPALGHQGPFTVTKEATCTEPGVQERDCTVCGAHETVAIPAAHKYGEDNHCVFCGELNPEALEASDAATYSAENVEEEAAKPEENENDDENLGSEDTETYADSPYHVELSIKEGEKYKGVVLAGETLVANLQDLNGNDVEKPANLQFYFVLKSGSSTDEQNVTMIPGEGADGRSYTVTDSYINGTVVCVAVMGGDEEEAGRSDTLRIRKEITINVTTSGKGDMKSSYVRLGDEEGETPVAVQPTYTFLTGDKVTFYVTPAVSEGYIFRRIATIRNNTYTAQNTSYDSETNTNSYTFEVSASSVTDYLLETDRPSLYNEIKPTLGDDSDVYISKAAEKKLETLRKTVAGTYNTNIENVQAGVIRYVTPIWASDALALSKTAIENAVANNLITPFTLNYHDDIRYPRDLIQAYHYNVKTEEWNQISTTACTPHETSAEIHDYTDFSPFAVIGIKQIMVTLDANNGSGNTITDTVIKGAAYTVPACSFTARDNEAFRCWLGSDGNEYKPGATVPKTALDGPFTLTAQWSEGHTIKFNKKNDLATGTMDSLFVLDGDEVTLTKNTFTLKNHEFKGWSETPDGEKVYDDEQKITPDKDLTLYAVWERTASTVYFNAHGGSGSMSEQKAELGGKITLAKNSFTYDDYLFAGWSTTEGGTVVYTDGQTINTPDTDITLYAVWKYQVTVSFDKNNANASGTMADQTVPGGIAFTLNKNSFTAPSMSVFNGWNTVKDGSGTAYTDGQTITGGLTESTTLYAQWKRTAYTISYVGNGGIGSMSSQTVPEYGAVAISDNKFTAPYGKAFVGWSKTAGVDNSVDFAAGTPIDWNDLNKEPYEDLTLYAVWKPLIMIHFDPASDKATGTGTMADQQIVSGVETALNANSFKNPTNWQFTGWNTAKDGSGASYADKANITTDAGLTLYAQWGRVSYTVSYDPNTGTGSMSAQTLPKDGAITASANSFTAPAGKAFIGWSKTSGLSNAVDYKAGAAIRWEDLSDDLTLYAVWEDQFTIHFDPASNRTTGTGTMADQKLVKGVAGKLNANAFKAPTGWEFTGWNEKQDGTGEKSYQDKADITLTADLTLYAQWQRVSYSVSYNANGGTGSTSAQTVPKDGAITVSANKFTAPAGKIFIGWSKTSGQTNEVDYKAGAAVSWEDLNKEPFEDLTLYAVWKDKVSIHFNPVSDSGTGTGTMADQEAPKGEEVTLNPNKFTAPTGMAFGGWNTAADGSGTAYKDGARITPTEDVTLYAQWLEDACTVTFDKNNDLVAGEPYKQSILKNTATALTANRFLPPKGLAFTGWNTKRDGSGTAFKDQATVKVSKDITLYAQWVSACTITFNKNAEGATGSMDAQVVETGVNTQLTANAFKRVNYSFDGWTTNPDGTGEKFADQGYVEAKSDMTLYAVWKQIAYAITYDANGGGGTQMAQQNVSVGNTATIRECAYTAKPGEVFAYWLDTESVQSNAGENGIYYPGEKITPTRDLALAAVWVDELVISYYPGEGSGTYNEGEAPKGVETSVKTAAEAKFTAPSGATFAYWQDEAGNKYYEGEKYRFYENTKLTAIWSAACVITYNKNASDATGTMATQTAPSGVEVTLHENKFTRSEYIFKYWTKTKSDPYPNKKPSDVTTSDVYKDGTDITVVQDTTLYAQWYKTAITKDAVMITGELTGLDDFAVWGETLTASVNDPVLKSGFTYTWLVDGSPVKSGTDNTYLVQKEDYGKPIVCVVSHPQATNEVESNTKIVGTYTESDDLMIINNGDSSYPYSKYAYVYGVVPGTTFYKDGKEYLVPESADGIMEIGLPGTYTFGYATYYIENWFTVGYEMDTTSSSGTVTMKNGTTTLTSTTKTSDIVHFVNTIWLVRDGSATDLSITMKPASSTYVHWNLNGGSYSSSGTEVSRRLGTINQPMLFAIVFNKSSSSPQTGDMSHLGVWSALCFTSFVGAATLIGKTRKGKKNRA